MKPIINPWLFYLIDVADNINLICIIMLVIALIASGLISICLFDAVAGGIIGEDKKQAYFKRLKTSLKVIIPCIIITILTPSSDTIYKMIIADNITPHNIEIVGDTVESSIDYIFEKINSLTLEEEVKE